MIKLKFRDNKDLGNICYQTGDWYQELYIDGNLVESTVKDIDIVRVINGEEHLEESISQEVYVLKFLAYPFIWRSLKNLRMHSEVIMTLENGENIYPKNIQVSKPEWVSLGEAALLEIQFILESTIKRNTTNNMS